MNSDNQNHYNDYEDEDEEYIRDEESVKVQPNVTNQKELRGIGGWLIFIAIGIVMSPISILYIMFYQYLTPIINGAYYILSQPDNPIYKEHYSSIFLLGAVGYNILFIFNIILLFMFFGKKKLFSKMYIAFLLLRIVFASLLTYIIYRIQHTFNPSTNLLQAIANAAIWIPYMLISVRVRNTFVR